MERKQFTFYRSFFDAVSRIRRKSVRADVYDAICQYGLNGEKPDLDSLSSEAAVALTLIMPVLETGTRKAVGAYKSNGKQLDTHWKGTGCGLDTDCKKENKKENKNEVEKERECEKDKVVGADGVIADFEDFWKAYPKKVGKKDARAAFLKVSVPVQTLLDALEKQKQSDQWSRENGRFVPNPATWLSQQRWEDELPPPGGIPKGASGKLGKEELESIQRMLKEG